MDSYIVMQPSRLVVEFIVPSLAVMLIVVVLVDFVS